MASILGVLALLRRCFRSMACKVLDREGRGSWSQWLKGSFVGSREVIEDDAAREAT